MDRDLTPDEIVEQWEMLRRQVLGCAEAIAEIFTPLLGEVIDQVTIFVVRMRREQLYWSLTKRRVPDRPARWIADKWPERWLPELNLG